MKTATQISGKEGMKPMKKAKNFWNKGAANVTGHLETEFGTIRYSLIDAKNVMLASPTDNMEFLVINGVAYRLSYYILTDGFKYATYSPEDGWVRNIRRSGGGLLRAGSWDQYGTESANSKLHKELKKVWEEFIKEHPYLLEEIEYRNTLTALENAREEADKLETELSLKLAEIEECREKLPKAMERRIKAKTESAV